MSRFTNFSGGAAVLFDSASVDTPEGRKVTFDLVARTRRYRRSTVQGKP